MEAEMQMIYDREAAERGFREVDAIGLEALAGKRISAAVLRRVAELIGIGITAEDAKEGLTEYVAASAGTTLSLVLMTKAARKIRFFVEAAP
jgi:hypothetical protein